MENNFLALFLIYAIKKLIAFKKISLSRSSWTETPEQKARKRSGLEKEENLDEVLQQEARARQIATRDEDQERAVK